MPKRAREDPCAICGHWHDYEGGEPCTVCGHTLARHDNSANKGSAFPTEILPGFLYLGSYDNASRSELLKTVGITHILNTVPACQNLYKNSFQYHTVSCKPPDYDECFTYLDAVQQEKGRVLVHCMTGTSTSPSVVIGYLMRLRRWRLSDSYKWVHDRQAVVSLQEGEAARLQQLEVQLLGESSTGFKVEAAQQSPGGPFAWSAWRDAPQPSPPALVASQPFSSFGQPNHTSSSNFVFGDAQAADIEPQGATAPYAAPELLRSLQLQYVDATSRQPGVLINGCAADWWATGVMLYELLIGELPFIIHADLASSDNSGSVDDSAALDCAAASLDGSASSHGSSSMDTL